MLIDRYGLGESMIGWNLTTARAVSADNQTIVGIGRHLNGNREAWIAFLGTPVPEPSTLLLAALALAPLTLRRHGERNRQPHGSWNVRNRVHKVAGRAGMRD
jgi:hypothetical protein